MIGLIALAILVFWGFVSYKLSAFLVGKVKRDLVRYGVQAMLCVLLFLAPVADDIAGGFQFRSLCNKGAVVVVDEEKAMGKVITYVGNVLPLDGYILPINKHYWAYKDILTNEIVIRWDIYDAEGGWLSHFLNFPEGNPPYTFIGHCAPNNYWSNFQKLKVKLNFTDKE